MFTHLVTTGSRSLGDLVTTGSRSPECLVQVGTFGNFLYP